MTIARRSRKGGPMLRWSFLLVLGILSLSLLVTSTVHAREFPGIPTIDCSGTVDKSVKDKAVSDDIGESREAPTDKSPPLQHATCHAPASSLPDVAASSPLFVAVPRNRLTRVTTQAPLNLIRLDIRPPIA